MRGEIRVECDVTPRHLTICECRPPWCEDFGPDWTRFPIARLHYSRTTRLWTLYWRDRNLKYHRYQPLDPSLQIQDLLDYLDSGTDPSSGDNHRLPSSQRCADRLSSRPHLRQLKQSHRVRETRCRRVSEVRLGIMLDLHGGGEHAGVWGDRHLLLTLIPAPAA
ncbi:MAG: DUF3024 domain-containing protein [Mycobacterium sp.]|jgi:hypothetical protein